MAYQTTVKNVARRINEAITMAPDERPKFSALTREIRLTYGVSANTVLRIIEQDYPEIEIVSDEIAERVA